MAPVLNPRGVINAFTQQPAPTVAPVGGIVWITGLNLGPPEGAEAKGAPLPTDLGGVKVLINNEPIPLVSVSPGKIVAQIPWNITESVQPVVMQLVVEANGVRSRTPARFFVRREEPALRAKGDLGYGQIEGKLDGRVLKASGTGFGLVEPAVESGAAGPPDLAAKPRAQVRAYVGGIPAEVTTGLSAERVGEFDVLIEIPPDAKPGDVVQLYVNNRMANRLTFSSLAMAETMFLKAPEGAEIRALSGSDLRGTYVLASGARGADGCYPSYVFDFQAQNVSILDGCLTAANRNAATPFIPVADGTAVSAFVGPPEGEVQQGISAKVRVLNPGQDPMDVDLPGKASTLQGVGGNTVVAVMPGPPVSAVGIDVASGAVRVMDNIGAVAGGGQAGGVLPGAAPALNVDLGGGLTHVLTQRVGIGGNRSVVVVGDDANAPKNAKLAILDARNQVVGSEDFPEGFVPLVAPNPPAQPGQAQPPQLLTRIRVSQNFDANTRTLYVLSRKPDDSAHGFAAFTFAQETRVRAIPFPEGRFAAACTANINIYSFELSRTLALFATNKVETEFKQVCEALGFIVLELGNQRVRDIPLPGAGFVNVTSAMELNDYLIGSNIGGARQPADTLDVLDGVNLTATRLQLPPGVTSFAGLRPVGSTGLLVAPAQKSTAGDEGLVVFDLDEAKAKLLPVPDGFMNVQLVDVMLATRKLVARGVKTGNTGAQYMIYDLVTTELELIPNPPGVAWVGGVPAQAPGGAGQPGAGQPGGGGQPGAGQPGAGQPGGGAPAQQPQQPQQPQAPTIYQDPNPKANTISAVCFDADRKPVGVMLLRIP